MTQLSEGTRSTLATASKLLSSSVIAQLAVLAALAYAASLATAANFAQFGLISAIASILAAGITLGAESRATVVSADQSRALTRAGFTSIVTLTILGLVLGIIGIVGDRSYGLIVLLAAVLGCSLAINQMLTGLVLREQAQGLLARNRLVQGLSNAALIVVLLFGPWPIQVALASAWAISALLGNLTLGFGMRHHLAGFRRAHKADWQLLWQQVRFQPVANVLMSFAGQLPLLVLVGSGTTTVAGAWALVSRFLTPIVNTWQSTVMPIYYGRAAARLREGDLLGFSKMHRQWSLFMAAMGALAMAGFAVVVWWLIPVLGSEWEIARVVTLAAVLQFGALVICLPLSQTLVLLHRNDLQVRWTFATMSVTAVAILSYRLIGAENALTFWAGASLAGWLAQLLLHRLAIQARLPHGGPPRHRAKHVRR